MPALIPSVTRMCPRIRFEIRCVWPTTMASTVVGFSRSAIWRIGPSHGTAGVLPTALLPVAVPSWTTTTWTPTPRLASRWDSAATRRLVEEREPPRRSRGHQLRRLLERGADHAHPHAVDLKTFDGVTQAGVLRELSRLRLVARNGKFARSWWARSRSSP